LILYCDFFVVSYLQKFLGIEFPQPTPPTPDSWYISKNLSPPQRDVYVPVDPIVDMSNWKPKKRHRSRKRKNPSTEDETQLDEQ
jgi:hypothetical protein